MTSEPQAPAAPAAPALGAAAALRRVALHEETAALLRQRASQAATPAVAQSLRQRADEHARRAAGLRAGLVARRRSGGRPARRGRAADS